MEYDKEAIEDLTQRIARFELPRSFSVSMDEYVISREKGHAWYPCQYCGSMIERTLQYANRKFTCYRCRKERQKKYDNSPVQVQKRKNRRGAARLGSPSAPLTEKEQVVLDDWNRKTTPIGIYRRLRRFQVKPR
jgi:hypothetical protein